MCSFCARKQSRRRRLSRWSRFSEFHLFGCVQWPEHCAHTTRFLGGRPIALTLLTPRAGTAVTNPSSIDHAHTAISFEATQMADTEGNQQDTGPCRLVGE
jgi:hypothetical protein